MNNHFAASLVPGFRFSACCGGRSAMDEGERDQAVNPQTGSACSDLTPSCDLFGLVAMRAA
jgi:hypothetical protein